MFRQRSVTGAIRNRDTTWNRGKGVYVIIELYTHLHYRVKWVGFDNPEDDTWKPAEHLSGARAKVKEYWQGQKKIY